MLQFSNTFISYLTLFITVTCNKCIYSNSKTQTNNVLVMKIHVCILRVILNINWTLSGSLSGSESRKIVWATKHFFNKFIQ